MQVLLTHRNGCTGGGLRYGAWIHLGSLSVGRFLEQQYNVSQTIKSESMAHTPSAERRSSAYIVAVSVAAISLLPASHGLWA